MRQYSIKKKKTNQKPSEIFVSMTEMKDKIIFF